MRRIFLPVLCAAVLFWATAGVLMAAKEQSLTIAPRTYQVGVTSAQRAIPNGTYSAFHITANFAPWTAPTQTTNVRLGMMLSFDGGTTFTELCSAGENTPPPWTIPAKYGGGQSSTVALDCFIPNGSEPTNAAGFVEVSDAAVQLGQITVTLS